MRRFFRSKKFIITACIACVLAVLTVIFGVSTGWSNPVTAFSGYVIAPIQDGFKAAGEAIDGFFGTFTEFDKLKQENAELREQLTAMQEQKLDWEQAIAQNEFYKDYLGIKEEHPDFTFCSAKVIARDPADPYGTMTVAAGSLAGVSPRDPVITSEGVIGYIGTVGPTYSTVITVLNPALKVSGFDNRTDDSGIAHGDVAAAGDSGFVMDNLSRYATVAKGDYIVTSGGGVFPSGLVLGTVTGVEQHPTELTLTARLTPTADIKNCGSVMVVTAFSGQSSLDDLLGE